MVLVKSITEGQHQALHGNHSVGKPGIPEDPRRYGEVEGESHGFYQENGGFHGKTIGKP